MKRILYLTTMVVAMLFAGCAQEFDDSEIWDKLNNHENRIATLEELCRQMNTNISSLQTIVTALQNNDYVTGVAPVTKNGETIGYTIIFTKSQPITIYHGENGKDGQNGTNGVDGKDGSTPVIGVKMDEDGIYYWTLNGEWLTDENDNKIKAVGTDGKDGADGKDGQNGTNGTDGKDGQNGTNGADGKDGITPKLKIEEGYWLISYDNGTTWTQLGKATGEDGAQGPQGEQGMQGPQGEQGNDGAQGPQGEAGINGDSFFQSVTQDENNVYIVLADGTEITIPKKINLDDVKLTYIPRYDDGKATVIYSYKSDSYVELDFEVSPANKAADWSDITTVKAVYTESRAGVEFVDMDILSWSTDATNGTISVKASGKNLSDDFFDGSQSASVRIAIENDDVNIISEYIPMVAERLPVPESNEIWYTATEKVTPYASDVFGANIISNEWDESTGQGIITLDGNVTSIGNHAFYSCSSLTSITIPESVTSIGYSAFVGCESLTSIVIPDSVTWIGGSAFHGCSSLTSITIPDSVTWIDWGAFHGCSSLTSITIPDSVTSIGEGAFVSCSSLTSIVIPDSVTSIGVSAFAGCTSLISITIPDSVTSIGNGAFQYCESLTSVTIGDSVTSIGDWAFSDCTSLTSVYCKPTIPPTLGNMNYVFNNNASGRKIYVPASDDDSIVNAYKTADYWSDYASAIEEYEFD